MKSLLRWLGNTLKIQFLCEHRVSMFDRDNNGIRGLRCLNCDHFSQFRADFIHVSGAPARMEKRIEQEREYERVWNLTKPYLTETTEN